MRFIGLDVHRDFCLIAISEYGQIRIAGKVRATPEKLEVRAEPEAERSGRAGGHEQRVGDCTNLPDASGADLRRHPQGSRGDRAGAKTTIGRLDAKVLARLLAAGLISGTWLPGGATSAQRRGCRGALRARSVPDQSKNESHAAV
jgi:hypothetical protein